MIIFEEALMLFEPLGINEPKPKNTKNMKYEDLDLKSIKLINWIGVYLQGENNLEKMFSEVKKTVKLKSKSKTIHVSL